MKNKWVATLNTDYFSPLSKTIRVGINAYFSDNYFVDGNIFLLFSGTVYNARELFLKATPPKCIHTNADEKIIIFLYKLYGIETTIQLLDGVFSFILLDNTTMNEKLFIVRDPLGISPLYCNTVNGHQQYSVKPIDGEEFTPASYSSFELGVFVNAKWENIVSNKKYYNLSFSNIVDKTIHKLTDNYFKYFENAIEKRCRNFTEPIGIYLTSDFGSNLLLSSLQNLYKKNGKSILTIERFSGTEDLNEDTIVSSVKTVFFSLGYFDTLCKKQLNHMIEYRDNLLNIHLKLPKFEKLEPQYPFLDKDFINYNLNIS